MLRETHDLHILDEDDDLLVVNKPAGLLVIPDRWDASKPTVVKRARAYLQTRAGAEGTIAAEPPRIWVVHRLDRDTSGVLILAKTDRAHAALSRQFEHGQARKAYLALVSGQAIRDEGVIRLPIGPHAHRPGMMAVRRRHGKSAFTRYAVLERFRGYTLLDVRPRTGRSHQIRVHLQAIGYPLAIDTLYGSGEPLLLSALKRSYRPKAGAVELPSCGTCGATAIYQGNHRRHHGRRGGKRRVCSSESLRLTWPMRICRRCNVSRSPANCLSRS